MAAGITQPGGAGTTIYIYDDSDTTGGRPAGPYTFAQISTAFPADVVDNGTNRKSYRFKVTLQTGDTGTGTATTTLQDTNVTAIWDSGKTLTCRNTQRTSWYWKFGTKVGTGNQASGMDGCDLTFGAAIGPPGNIFIYGSTLRQTSGTLSMAPFDTPPVSEVVNCIIASSSSGTTPLGLGNAFSPYSNVYNVDFTHVTTAQMMNNFGALSAERITMACSSPLSFVQTAVSGLIIKDIVFIGSPTSADMRWTNSAAVAWRLVRPRWSGNANKLGNVSGAHDWPIGDDSSNTQEMWLLDSKVVDGTGSGISGIPVKLTDGFGNVQANTTTDSSGAISFNNPHPGLGTVTMLQNAVAIVDHYAASGVYGFRIRNPFTLEANLPSMTGYNANYESYRRKFKWPGSEGYTANSGQLEDVVDVISLQAVPGNPTTWVECEL
jgi:hypothetical protein